MNIHSKFLAVIFFMAAFYHCQAQNAKSTKHEFNIYGFIVYAGYTQNGTNVKASYKELQQYLLTYGIKNLNLIYEGRMLDYPGEDKKNGVPNTERVDELAQAAITNPNTPVSLDLEGWIRWDTIKTPARMIEAIRDFKKLNKVSKVGVYATVPQNTYGYQENINRYDKVNHGYAPLAAVVDYFSPSLYNYGTVDTISWNKAAAYNIEACKKYNFPNKPIIPYITPEVDLKGVKRMLTYDEMMNHLQTLYNLGAKGVLIWTSSGMRDENGNKPYVDINSGWAKAVKDFMATH